MADLFSKIIEFIIIKDYGVYPKITMLDFSKPSNYSEDDYFLLEKYQIPRNSAEEMIIARRAVFTQQVMFYMNNQMYRVIPVELGDPAIEMGNQIFMSKNLYMGGYTLQATPTFKDISDMVKNGTTSFIDIETDLSTYSYIYRIVYYNNGTSGASEYVMCGDASAIIDQYESGEYETSRSESLYRYNTDGIIVEKGVPIPHVTNRYQGPIEQAKEEARRTAIYATQEYLDSLLDTTDTSISGIYNDIVSVGNQISCSLTL